MSPTSSAPASASPSAMSVPSGVLTPGCCPKLNWVVWGGTLKGSWAPNWKVLGCQADCCWVPKPNLVCGAACGCGACPKPRPAGGGATRPKLCPAGGGAACPKLGPDGDGAACPKLSPAGGGAARPQPSGCCGRSPGAAEMAPPGQDILIVRQGTATEVVFLCTPHGTSRSCRAPRLL